MSADILLAAPVRSAIGTFNGAFAEVPATALGAAVIRASLQRAGISPSEVDEVIMGNVLSAGLGQNPARQAALGAGITPAVSAVTINKVCGSGLKAVMLAAQAIRCGDASIIIAGGMENMSRAPYLLEKARNGYRLGHGQLIDSLIRDGLWDAYTNVHMGTCGEACAKKYAFTRNQQDDFAIASHSRAREAVRAGLFAREIIPVDAPSGKTTAPVTEDQGPARFDEAKLRNLKPAFASDGTITAANASSLNDGAAAVTALSSEKARDLRIQPQAKILGHTSVAGEPEWFTLAPIAAIAKLLAQLRLTVADIDLFEINEAFAAVPMAAMADLRIPHEKVNILGGAIALGHPIGASGARTLVTLLTALKWKNARIGITALCIGGGEAVAMAVEML
jgi:acetyl-CoA C-acetyltransferase